MKQFIVAGGKTGGHFFPGLAVSLEIIKQNREFKPVFVGTKDGIESKKVPELGYSLEFVISSGFYGKSWAKKLLSLSQIPISFLQSLYYIFKYKAVFVLGLGGYSSFGACLASIILRKPLFLLEQNTSPGIVNRFFRRFATLIFSPLGGSAKASNILNLGNPLRPEIEALASLPFKNFSVEPMVLFVFGGSQGAKILNRLVVQMLPMILAAKLQIKIIHQTGFLEFEQVKKLYQSFMGLDYVLVPFVEDMAFAYQNSNLVICRGGASVFELTAAQLPAILVPILNSSADHQLKNCLELSKHGAAIVLKENVITAKILFKNLKILYENPLKLANMSKNARKMFQAKGAAKIASACLEKLV